MKVIRFGCNFTTLSFLAILLCICRVPVQADWNSTTSIESVATRVSVDVVGKGIKLTARLTDDALEALIDNSTELSLFSGNLSKQELLNVFAAHIIGISSANTQLLVSKEYEGLSPALSFSSEKQPTKVFNTTVFFPFAGTKPQELLIAPDFELLKKAGQEFAIAVSHNGLPVIDHGVLTAPETLHLDWQDPWYSHFLNPALKRDHNDPVMAFLYVESQVLKCEIVVRVKELASWMQLELRDENLIHEDEYKALKQRIGQFLLRQNSLIVDNKTLQPTLERIGYIRMGADDIQAYQPTEAQQPETTLVGISLRYPIQGFPNIAQWRWKLFSEKINSVSIRAYDPVGVFDSYVTPEYPLFEWENQLAEIGIPTLQSVPVVESEVQSQLPGFLLWLGIALLMLLLIVCWKFLGDNKFRSVSLICIAVMMALSVFLFPQSRFSIFTNPIDRLDGPQVEQLFHQLLWNVYQAFEEKQEGTVYDQLSLSVSGDLLETLYLKNRRKLLITDGAWSKISDIKMQTVTPGQRSDEGGTMRYDCEWLVIGEVIHWGHQHRRENLYRASISVAAVNGYWKIIKLQSLDQQRMESDS